MGRRTLPKAAPLVRFSAALTGREQLLSVVVAISPSGDINATALDTDLPDLGIPAISKELRMLEEAGLLRRREKKSSYAEYEVTDTAAWKALRTLADAARDERVSVP